MPGPFDWLGSLFGAPPTYTPNIPPQQGTTGPEGGLGGLLDPRALRRDAAWQGLGALSAGLIAAGQRRPAASPSLMPQAFGAFQPAYQGALSQGYQQAGAEQQFRQREAAERTRLEREQAWQTALAAATPAERTLMQQMGPDQWAQMQGQVQASLRRPTAVAEGGSLVIPQSGETVASVPRRPERPDAPQLVRNDDGSLDIWYPPARGGAVSPPAGGQPQAPAPPGGAVRTPPPGMPGGTRPITPPNAAQSANLAAIGSDPLAYPGGPHDPYRGWEPGQPDLPIAAPPAPERGAMPPTVRPGARPPAVAQPTTAPPATAAPPQQPTVPGLVQLRPPRPVDPTHLSGQALDAQMYNIYNRLDAAAAERQLTPGEQRALDQAERHLTATRTLPDGSTIVPGPLPSVRRRDGAAPAPAGDTPQQAAAPPAQAAAPQPVQRPGEPPVPEGMYRTRAGTGYVDRPLQQQPATAITQLTENAAAMTGIDRALGELARRENSVGAVPGAIAAITGDRILQRTDPEGTALRAQIAQIASTRIHSLAGASQTVAEVGRLRPFIPDISDNHETIRTKLAGLREALADMTGGLYETYGPSANYRPLPNVERVLNPPDPVPGSFRQTPYLMNGTLDETADSGVRPGQVYQLNLRDGTQAFGRWVVRPPTGGMERRAGFEPVIWRNGRWVARPEGQ